MKNTQYIIVHCSWTIFNSNLPEMELKIFILNLWEIRVERQRMSLLEKSVYSHFSNQLSEVNPTFSQLNPTSLNLGQSWVCYHKSITNYSQQWWLHTAHYCPRQCYSWNCDFTFPWFWQNCKELAYQPGFWICLVVLWQSIPCKHGIFNPHCPTRLSSASEFNSTTVISSSWM